jgi:hypothetical protein
MGSKSGKRHAQPNAKEITVKTTETQLKEFYVKFFVSEEGERKFLAMEDSWYFTGNILDSDVIRFSEKDKHENWDYDTNQELQTLPVKIRYEIEIG